jgi:tRNA-specific 2-thiouridylase
MTGLTRRATKHARIVVGLSGGVDSAVSAYLLKQQGHEVVGLFMKNWEDDDDDEYCSTRQDLLDAAAVADVIGIELEAVNFAAEYKDRVFASFLAEYSAGRTPNPDVLCNAEIKFKAFLDHAIRLGAERIATGHYARVRATADTRAARNEGAVAAACARAAAADVRTQTTADASVEAVDQESARFELLRGVDPGKDQSYFLHRLNQTQLSRAVFPVGHLHKSEARRIASEIALPNATKRDSTGICFIGERPFREFLNRYLPTQPGPIFAPDGTPHGRRVGEHVGLAFYTLGQRKGIGIGGMNRKQGGSGSGEPWFVARKDMASNTLWVVQGHDHPWLLTQRLHAQDAAWVGGQAPAVGTRLTAKTRYRQADAPCVVTAVSGATFELAFDTPQWAVTPGQSAVLYAGEVTVGGGVIA